MPSGGIRTHDRSRQAAVDLLLRPRGHWNWHRKQVLMRIEPSCSLLTSLHIERNLQHVSFLFPTNERPLQIQCFRKVALHLGYGTYIWLSVSKLPLQCAVVSLYSVVKQRLKCNTGKLCNCLIQFLLYRRLCISPPTPFISNLNVIQWAG
jgi:hypothetical protein